MNRHVSYAAHIIKALIRGTTENFFSFTVYFVCSIFIAFTVLGVLGYLPKEIQVALGNDPLFKPGSKPSATKVASVVVPAVQQARESLTAGVAASLRTETRTQSQTTPVSPVRAVSSSGRGEEPTRIVISRIGVDAKVLNPESIAVTALDEALKKGAVRYPESGKLNEGRTVFLFGHSSYLKTVRNLAYRTFNGLQNLKPGDEIRVEGVQNAYLYRVESVTMQKDSEAYVDLQGSGDELVLSTCNTFGAKQDRIIVRAKLVRSFHL